VWGDCSACRVSFAKAMEMCHLVSVDNPQRETRNARVLHLSIHIRINLCKIGSGLRIHTYIVGSPSFRGKTPVGAGAERTWGGDPWVALVSLSPSRMENHIVSNLDILPTHNVQFDMSI